MSGNARPVIDDAEDDVVAGFLAAYLDDVGRRRELQRVFEEVDEDVLELRGIHADRGRIVRDHDLDPPAFNSQNLERPGDEAVNGPELRRRTRSAGLETREVEQIGYEPIEPPYLKSDRGEQFLPIRARQRLTGALEDFA